MTPLLQQALTEVQKLSAVNQDRIAALLLENLATERRGEAALVLSQERLATLAGKVRTEIQAGRIRDLRMNES